MLAVGRGRGQTPKQAQRPTLTSNIHQGIVPFPSTKLNSDYDAPYKQIKMRSNGWCAEVHSKEVFIWNSVSNRMPPWVWFLNLTLTDTRTCPLYFHGIKCLTVTPKSPTMHWLYSCCHSNQDTGDSLTAPHIKYRLNPIEVYLSVFLTYIKSNITVIYCKNRDRNAPWCLRKATVGKKIIKLKCRLRLPDKGWWKGSETCRGGKKNRGQTREKMQSDFTASKNSVECWTY